MIVPVNGMLTRWSVATLSCPSWTVLTVTQSVPAGTVICGKFVAARAPPNVIVYTIEGPLEDLVTVTLPLTLPLPKPPMVDNMFKAVCTADAVPSYPAIQSIDHRRRA